MISDTDMWQPLKLTGNIIESCMSFSKRTNKADSQNEDKKIQDLLMELTGYDLKCFYNNSYNMIDDFNEENFL